MSSDPSRILFAAVAAGLMAAPAAAQRPIPPEDGRAPRTLVARLAPAAEPARAQFEDDEENPDACWTHDYVGLSQHPIGFTLRKPGLRLLSNRIPMHPIGYASRRYSSYPGLTYGFGANGFQAAVAVMEAVKPGTDASVLFPGFGIQKQLLGNPCEYSGQPSVSVGAYGYTGHGHDGVAAYVAGSQRVVGTEETDHRGYVHVGLEYEHFDGPAKSSNSVRPFLGVTLALFRQKLALNMEVAAKSPWEPGEPFAIMATVPLYKSYGISFGIKSNGFDTRFSGPF